jgi:hypothetical protein
MDEHVELLLRLLCDVLPKQADAAYLFVETERNLESIFHAGRQLADDRRTGRLLISDCSPKSGYVGTEAFREAMKQSGIPAVAIEEVPMEPTPILHTLIEAQAVVHHAKARGYQSLVVIAAPFHQERAFITTASVAIRIYPELKLYSLPGRGLAWDEVVTHSQGVDRKTRLAWLAAEYERIEKYTAKGDLLPRARILEYLRRRDDT